jgi:hypothetical protein
MRKINLLFSLYSLNVLLITIERLTPFTSTLLQPYNFLELHYLLQGPIFLTVNIIISAFILKEITNNFESLKTKVGFYSLMLLLAGAYIFGFGEGFHELGSFFFNQFCPKYNFSGDLCNSAFINDYYTGNIIFYIGFFLMTPALMFLEKINPVKSFDTKNLIILLVNSFIYSLSHIAYAAFDRAIVGISAEIILLFITLPFFYSVLKKYRQYPYITYSMFAYTIALLVTAIIRFH